jgi:hypothetical protein
MSSLAGWDRQIAVLSGRAGGRTNCRGVLEIGEEPIDIERAIWSRSTWMNRAQVLAAHLE